MIIVSQGKGFIVNFKNIHSIGVDKVNGEYHINFVVGSGDGTLGQYDTKERAKEVLEEIVKLYEEKDLTVGNMAYANVNYPKVYRMPEV